MNHPPKTRILIVDDCPHNVAVTSDFIRSRGLECITVASSGEAALEALAREHFDVLFLDIVLPGIDGHETARRFRLQKPNSDATRIIALTGNILSHQEARLYDAVLSKPILAENLDVVFGARQQSGNAPSQMPNQALGQAPSQTRPHFPTDIHPALNPDKALANVGGNLPLYWKSLRIFQDHGPGIVTKLERCLAEGNLPEAGKLAHRLKTNLRMIGAEELGDAVQALQKACSTNSAPECMRMASGCIPVVREILVALGGSDGGSVGRWSGESVRR